MWTCPDCNQHFVYQNVRHSCNERKVDDFLEGKSEHTKQLFYHLVNEYQKMGEIALHPAKSRIAFAADTRFAYVHRLGRNYVDVVFMFQKKYEDNYCFYKIAQVPDSKQCNHYFRMERKEDLNDEVRMYMQLAYNNGKKNR